MSFDLEVLTCQLAGPVRPASFVSLAIPSDHASTVTLFEHTTITLTRCFFQPFLKFFFVVFHQPLLLF